MIDQFMRNTLASVHTAANRFCDSLTGSDGVQMAINEMRASAERFERSLQTGEFDGQDECDLANTLFQLHVFFTNSWSGMQQNRSTCLHPDAVPVYLDHLRQWTDYFGDLAAVLEQQGDVARWIANNPIPPGQPGQATAAEKRAREHARASRPPAPPPKQPSEPKLTRRFMWRFRQPQPIRAGDKLPCLDIHVDLIDGELNYIPENITTEFVVGDPVMLPPTPCPDAEWESWRQEFLRTHPVVGFENIRAAVSEGCYVIRDPGSVE